MLPRSFCSHRQKWRQHVHSYQSALTPRLLITPPPRLREPVQVTARDNEMWSSSSPSFSSSSSPSSASSSSSSLSTGADGDDSHNQQGGNNDNDDQSRAQQGRAGQSRSEVVLLRSRLTRLGGELSTRSVQLQSAQVGGQGRAGQPVVRVTAPIFAPALPCPAAG